MDLLSRRYANPCFVLSGYIQTGRFCEFIHEFAKIEQEEKNEKALWEYFMHKMPFYEGSFNDFVEETKQNQANMNMSASDFETTFTHTQDILMNFSPDRG